jgi:hypothetical protein
MYTLEFKQEAVRRVMRRRKTSIAPDVRSQEPPRRRRLAVA